MPDYWAHPKNVAGQRQMLDDHARAVAEAAAGFAAPFGGSELARYLGLWHDAGKYGAPFQAHLLALEEDLHGAGRAPDHKAAGMLIARKRGLNLLLPALLGHHGGLPARDGLEAWLAAREEAAGATLAAAQPHLPEVTSPAPLPLPPYVAAAGALGQEFFVRMLFSVLVDANLAAAEEHFSPEIRVLNAAPPGMTELRRRYHTGMSGWAGAPDSVVERARAAVQDACVEAGSLPPGCFRLNAPAAAGNGLTMLAFALEHAHLHGLRRIVAAVPHTSSTGPLAEACRALFDRPSDVASPVLEHHSAAGELRREDEEYVLEDERRRLAAENWDAPVVITTATQLFEGMFAGDTGRCRRLHRLAGSVILLDEAHLLPLHLLDPIASGIDELCAHYGASVVLGSSVPGFGHAPLFGRVDAREILVKPDDLFARLGRARCEWRLDPPLTWIEVAGILRGERQALYIVNGSQDALDLLDALGDASVLHLSSLLCGRQRSDVLREARLRLGSGAPCLLVATAAAEAGAEIDFPVVLRAHAPLDRIVLAAGCANREGRLPYGRVIIFRPLEGRPPEGDAEWAMAVTDRLLAEGPADLEDPETLRRYYSLLREGLDADRGGVQALRRAFDYPGTAQAARFTADTVSVVVPYGSEDERRLVQHVWQGLENRAGNLRESVRRLQPYTVDLRWEEARRHLGPQQIRLSSTLPRLGLWLGAADPVLGIRTGLPADKILA